MRRVRPGFSQASAELALEEGNCRLVARAAVGLVEGLMPEADRAALAEAEAAVEDREQMGRVAGLAQGIRLDIAQVALGQLEEAEMAEDLGQIAHGGKELAPILEKGARMAEMIDQGRGQAGPANPAPIGALGQNREDV